MSPCLHYRSSGRANTAAVGAQERRRPVYSLLNLLSVSFVVCFLTLGASTATAQDSSRILTVNLGEWMFLPVYDAGDVRGVFAYRQRELKKFDILWFDRRQTGWAPYVYMGHA